MNRGTQTAADVVVRVHPSPRAPRDARWGLRQLAASLPRETYEYLELLTSELVTNSYRHGALPAGSTIEITAHITPGEHVRVDVWDPGPGLLDALHGHRASPQGAGWGLRIVDRLASRWGVRREGRTCVWFELDFP